MVVWSADEAPDLEAAMRAVYDRVLVEACPAQLQGREETYWLYAGR